MAERTADYHVIVSAGGVDTETEWQFVPSASERTEFHRWLAEPLQRPSVVLPLLPATNSPYETIAFVWAKRRTRVAVALSALAQSAGAKFISPTGPDALMRAHSEAPTRLNSGDSLVLTSAEPVELSSMRAWGVGSGVAFDNGELRRSRDVVGALSSAPIAGRESPRFMSRNCGDFLAAVRFADGHTEFHTDYLGVSGWFEYVSDKVHIVASSFLLAVRVAAAVGENLALNLDVIDADFTSLTQPFQQPLLDQLELAGFSCVTPDKVLSVSSTGERMTSLSLLGSDVAAPDRLTAERYTDLIEQAAEEIRANCRAIVSDPDIESIRCDITGGLDSRLVLAGILSTAASDTRVSLFTEESAGSDFSDDEEVALLIADYTGLSFSDQTAINIGQCAVEHLAAKQVAATFGTYWHRLHDHPWVWDAKTVYVGGAGLGNVARDYSTSGWQLAPARVAAVEEVARNLALQVFKWRGRASLKAAPRAGISSIASAWDTLPGDEAEKGSLLFNFHRARFHGGGAIPASLGAWRISPGATRALHLLRLMAGPLLNGPRVQIDLIHKLNPGLAAIPYGRESYNEAYSAVHGELRRDLRPNPGKLTRARKEATEHLTWVDCETCAATPSRTPASREALATLAHESLRELGRDEDLREILLPAYRFFRDHLGTTFPLEHSYSRTVMNKVLHLHALWSLAVPSQDRQRLGSLGAATRAKMDQLRNRARRHS
ncbi:hypothetical protein [Microbacterium aquimaris]|uniref:Asparagine synthetase domain-containing protein n=1 Tax=Microbacterium aquimaris TaxID=459816 RepID=A0ABU5N639_9MICO|nr:hypothetical protein [Microbacterium aquimaris]MDZ8161540.1 hypothetical protein [Microbacterium aquimaris]